MISKSISKGLWRHPHSPFYIIGTLVTCAIILIFKRQYDPSQPFVTINGKNHGGQTEKPVETAILPDETEKTSITDTPFITETPDEQPDPYDGGSIQPPKNSTHHATPTKTIITGHTKDEDVGWIRDNFLEPEYLLRIYSVDDSESADLHTPINKGHEAMPYLTYILTHYHNLSDISIFLHPHQYAWHTYDSLLPDSADMLHRLNMDKVQRVGYANLRCKWNPGCPAHIDTHSLAAGDDMPEQAIFADAWKALFPKDPMPSMMGAACCSQFAVTRETLQSIPYEKYEMLRDWITNTELDDGMAGRVFESLWQYLFLGEAVVCPREHMCYCDSYGLCFGGENEYAQFEWLRDRKNEIEGKVGRLEESMKEEKKKLEGAWRPKDRKEHEDSLDKMSQDRVKAHNEVERLTKVYNEAIDQAYVNGQDPAKRLKELGGRLV
ncbi:hypothetical protein JX265_004463 [Neoarthrinium moseri]|uniref:Uncharacterized protein n=1 Tax=Neoarthrinium moseri TaxID=1658444 RepID=A0A9P9WQW8_9PEZI|nr:hypothetical protein JX265_004463 [Neoarthrinium moseri]